MSISIEQVEQVANLARIKMDRETLGKFAAQLDQIVSYIDKLNELDTSDVEPLTNASGLMNAFRKDEPGTCLERERGLANSASQAQGHYRVPKVIE